MRHAAAVVMCVAVSAGVASAQSVITNIERNAQGRVSTVTSTSDRGTVRTEFVHSGSRTQATTTYERANSGYNPLGQGGYKPLGR